MRTYSWLVLCLIMACGSPQPKTEDDRAADTTATKTPSTAKPANILFFGTSLTAGHGLEDSDLAFPGLIQQRIDSLGLPYRVINGGLSGETSAAGNERIDWLLNEPLTIFVLELGANDGLRGIPTEETYKNLQSIIDKVKQRYPDCRLILAGMMVPPSMGGTYGRSFSAMFPKLAEANDMAFVPFLLDRVAGETDLNLEDGIHPNEQGHQIVANTVWQTLQPML
ncbi:arylesterase [Parapedobacter sp. DT-150]|uniref:arylesterase n=1 Tax=Parapedobacter sp. DT-150 TaxID=3396162 RepID=UPI003F1E2CE2